MSPRTCALFFVATTLACGAVPASAQSSPGAYRTLFGPDARDGGRPDQVTLALSTYGGGDASRFGTGAVLDDTLQAGRAHVGAALTLNYQRRRPRTSLSITGASAVRYYDSLNRIGTQKHGGSIGADVKVSKQLSLRAAQDVTYSPAYLLELAHPPLQDDAALPVFAPPDGDYALSREKQISYGSITGATYAWSDTRTLILGYNRSYSNYLTRPDYTLQQASARYTHRLSRAIALRLGYGRTTARLTGLPATAHHDLDLGLAYDRAVSFSPRTTLAFSSGSTVVSVGGQRQFELLGSLNLRRLLSPRWTAIASLQRSVASIDGLPQPYVASTVSGELSGVLGSRTRVTLQPGFSRGAEVTNAQRTFHSFVSSGRVEMAVSRHWAVYVEHFVYDYRFAATPDLPLALAIPQSRQGLRFGLALWTPVSR